MNQLWLIMMLGVPTIGITATVYDHAGVSVAEASQKTGKVFKGFDASAEIVKAEYAMGNTSQCQRYKVAYTYHCLVNKNKPSYGQGILEVASQ